MKSDYAHLYGRQWAKYRKRFLQANPLCRMCEQQGYIEEATVVDHIKPHKGDLDLFFDLNNLQSVCKAHHDSDLQSIEARGFDASVGEDGLPSDPNHPFNRS